MGTSWERQRRKHHCAHRQENAGREPCMVAPQLGVEDLRVLCFYESTWGQRDWDSMQFAFDDLNKEVVESGERVRVVLVHGGNGAPAMTMADRMVRARYGWTVEPHVMGWGHAETKLAAGHMADLGFHMVFFFQKDKESTDRVLGLAKRTVLGRLPLEEISDRVVRVVTPVHDLELLARKGLTPPPRLGEDIG